MNPTDGPGAQKAVSLASARLFDAGWVANHDGNVSVRAPDGVRFWATPTAFSKRDVKPHDVICVDAAGKVLNGRHRVFSEWTLHAACYRARDDVKAVLHAHPPHATAFGLARRQLGVPTLPEIVVSLGASIPTLDFAMPKSESQARDVERALTAGDADVVLLAGNGVVSVGQDLEQAHLRLELVEHYARTLAIAEQLGGAVALPAADVDKLLAAREKAGLGRKARERS